MHTVPRHLIGPWFDALLLGGGSVIAFLICRSVAWTQESVAVLAGAMMVLAHFVNHPHFAHSYQLFYGQIRQRKAEGWGPEKTRLLAVAFLIPLVLAALLLWSALEWRAGNRIPMGLMVNLMGALVGWHYVKQGFGMAMTDAALKRAYWTPTTRKALLLNAYLCWALTWMFINSGNVGSLFWGVFHSRMAIPMPAVIAVAGLTLFSTLRTGVLVHRDFLRHRSAGVSVGSLPWAGLVGYTVSLYLWTVFASVDPAFLLMIPFFHSLQYLAVVYRCRWHETAATSRWTLLQFALLGLVLGWLGFWAIPGYLDFSKIDWMWTHAAEPALAIACFWLFINVHHYFIDSVLWRATNPYVKAHLFGVSAPAKHEPPGSAGIAVRSLSS